MPGRRKKLRVILDTNIWISYLISSKVQLDDLLKSRIIIILFSAELINELKETAKKPRLQKYFPEHRLDELIKLSAPCREWFV